MNRKYYLHKTPYGTCRLYLQSAILFDEALCHKLNEMSCWGGSDKRGSNYVSWEFPVILEPQLGFTFGLVGYEFTTFMEDN